jgi:hypothetical protein
LTKSKVGRRIFVTAGIFLILGIIGLAVIHILAGRTPSLRGTKSFLLSFVRSTLDSRSVKSYNKGDYTSIIFLHQSTGRNLIEQGKVREQFQQAGYDFWDHDYNSIGLRNPNGQLTGYSYNVPKDNTNPDGLAGIFQQPACPLPFNTFSGLLQHEVIILKSCFPNSNIQSKERLAQLKAWYLDMRSRMDQYPDKIFIILTQPPLNPVETSPEIAVRARALADWLDSAEFTSGHPNVYVFNFFNQLVEQDPAAADYNMLRQAYRDGIDSHPNELANQTIGPQFVDFVIEVIQRYRVYSP